MGSFCGESDMKSSIVGPTSMVLKVGMVSVVCVQRLKGDDRASQWRCATYCSIQPVSEIVKYRIWKADKDLDLTTARQDFG